MKNLTTGMLAYVKKLGAQHAQCALNESKGFAVNVRMGEIETLEHHHSKNFAITVYFGNHTGSATTNDLSMQSLRMAAEKACHIAKFTQADPYAGLAEKKLLAFNYPDLNLCHPWAISIEEAVANAKQCEAVAMAYDKRITNSDGCSIETSQSYDLYANTHDFIGEVHSTVHHMFCALVAEQNGSMQRDFDYSQARNSKNLIDGNALAKSVAQRVIKRLGARVITTRQCPVIFNPTTAKKLLSSFLRAINGDNLYLNSSFLLNSLNTQIFPDFINLDERPHLLGDIGSMPFDNEGVATTAKYFVKNGIVKNYLLDSCSGRKLKMPTTGNAGGVHNLFITPGENDLQGLFKLMNTGLYITEVLGNGINVTTGDYSCGAFGFWVENGEIKYPVEEITVAGNLREMFKNIIAVGNDVDYRGGIKPASVLIKNMVVAGK